jgi:hypothetical protein
MTELEILTLIWEFLQTIDEDEQVEIPFAEMLNVLYSIDLTLKYILVLMMIAIVVTLLYRFIISLFGGVR